MGGQYGYVLEDRKTLPFVACKGHLGLWVVPDEVMEEIEKLQAAAALPRVL